MVCGNLFLFHVIVSPHGVRAGFRLKIGGGSGGTSTVATVALVLFVEVHQAETGLSFSAVSAVCP
jgi:hypothetical protein